MPAWEDYKAEATARGALAHELYVVHSTPAGAPELVKEHLPAHLAYQREQEAAGHLFMAGPMSDDTGTQMQGVGLIIYRAASLDDARRLAENDPMHAAGARSFTIRRWLVNEGALTLSVSFAGQTAKLG